MIEYVCKYTPVEILAGFGAKAVLYNEEGNELVKSDMVIHRNLCGFSRILLEHRLENRKGALILTDCCDSIRRVHDVLDKEGQPVFLLDLPHRNIPGSRLLFKQQLRQFIDDYAAFSHVPFDIASFKAACKPSPPLPTEDHILLLGARISCNVFSYLQDHCPLPIANGTCTGLRTMGDPPETDALDDLLDWYATALLSQIPCLRMAETDDRKPLVDQPNTKGIIYNTVGFCDYYGFEYAQLKRQTSLPMLKIETDYTFRTSGQLRTRLDAFLERLALQGEIAVPEIQNRKNRWYVVGIDSGSTSTNVVILDDRKRIRASSVLPTGVDIASSASRAMDEAVKQAGIRETDIIDIVTTGYGRFGLKKGNRNVTEITCHAKGAHFLDPTIRTVLDIGGQDSKVIRIDEAGTVQDFAMNDKCAAGTGRFLEMMAQSLEVPLEQLGSLGLDWNEDIHISSMCSVFAQSEVVSLIAAGKTLPDIVHAIHASIASRLVTLGGRVKMEGSYMMTGGVARNGGVVQAIEEKLGSPVAVPEQPELCGALGAALSAWEDKKH